MRFMLFLALCPAHTRGHTASSFGKKVFKVKVLSSPFLWPSLLFRFLVKVSCSIYFSDKHTVVTETF